MNDRRKRILYIAQAALIAAVYTALVLLFEPISFNYIQFRIAEALTILPLFTSAAVPGLFLGCILGNLFGGAVILDVIGGSLATLIGAFLGYRLRNSRWLVPVPTVIANALIVPFVLRYGYGMQLPILLMALYVFLGEMAGSYLLGEILGSVLLKQRKHFFQE
ncbi:MAG: QueT transporter family protein [Erysipelotrichaceae bacterium]|nr:QueT transporter family protein [Erysipelotrichaceae bacterium]